MRTAQQPPKRPQLSLRLLTTRRFWSRVYPGLLIVFLNLTAPAYALFFAKSNDTFRNFWQQSASRANVGFVLSVLYIVVAFVSMFGTTFGYMFASKESNINTWMKVLLGIGLASVILVPLLGPTLVDITNDYSNPWLCLDKDQLVCTPPGNAVTFWRFWFVALTFVASLLGSTTPRRATDKPVVTKRKSQQNPPPPQS